MTCAHARTACVSSESDRSWGAEELLQWPARRRGLAQFHVARRNGGEQETARRGLGRDRGRRAAGHADGAARHLAAVVILNGRAAFIVATIVHAARRLALLHGAILGRGGVGHAPESQGKSRKQGKQNPAHIDETRPHRLILRQHTSTARIRQLLRATTHRDGAIPCGADASHRRGGADACSFPMVVAAATASSG